MTIPGQPEYKPVLVEAVSTPEIVSGLKTRVENASHGSHPLDTIPATKTTNEILAANHRKDGEVI